MGLIKARAVQTFRIWHASVIMSTPRSPPALLERFTRRTYAQPTPVQTSGIEIVEEEEEEPSLTTTTTTTTTAQDDNNNDSHDGDGELLAAAGTKRKLSDYPAQSLFP